MRVGIGLQEERQKRRSPNPNRNSAPVNVTVGREYHQGNRNRVGGKEYVYIKNNLFIYSRVSDIQYSTTGICKTRSWCLCFYYYGSINNDVHYIAMVNLKQSRR
jgi:hypothetical protein